MKILIDGQTLATPEMQRGIGVYFRNVIENILANDLSNDFFLAANDGQQLDWFSPWVRDRIGFIQTEATNSSNSETEGTAHYSDFINRTIENEAIDVYWTPNPLMTNVMLARRESARATFAATIFDLIPLTMKDRYEREWPRDILKNYEARLTILKRDYDLLLHISACTRDDFHRLVQKNGKRHVVTHLAAADRFRPYPFPQFAGTKNYILFPGGFDPRKNMDHAVEAFARLAQRFPDDATVQSIDLVIACHYNYASRARLEKHARKLEVAERIHLTGYLSDDEIVKLYQNARCLFFPSLYEGFGLPVLEGLACGLPIATSNVSSIPEIAGDFAYYFDPSDIDDMASVLYRALHAPRDLKSRIERSEYAQKFSWTKTALTTIEAWTCAVKENQTRSVTVSA